MFVYDLVKRLFAKRPPELEIEQLEPGDVVVRAGGHELTVSLPSLDLSSNDDDFEPLPPIKLDSPACPYCGIIQDPPPQRRKKCRDCGELMYTWTDYDSRVKYLLTAAQSKRQAQKERDERWVELNQQTLDAYRTGDFHSAMMAHYEQARILFERGADHHRTAQAACKDELRHYRQNGRSLGVDTVVIRTLEEAACAVCAPFEGRAFSIKEALKLMPIPHRDCETLGNENKYGGLCRCSYEPVIPEFA